MRELTEQIFLLDDFFDEHLCEEWIDRAEEHGFDAGAILTPHGERMAEHIRSCQEAVLYDEEAALALTQLLMSVLGEHPQFRRFQGVHPRLRVLRYDQEQFFAPHTDASIRAEDGTGESAYTLLVYLNTPLKGGETCFPDRWGDPVEVEAVMGRALCFEHDVLHAGAEVEDGLKYLLRVDLLMWRE